MRRSSLLFAVALAAACGTEPIPESVAPNSPRNRLPNAPPCTARVVYVAPAPEKVPAARSTSIVLLTDGPVDHEAKVVAMDAEGVVDGELLIAADGVEMVPHRPFAQGTVTWEAIVCGAHLAGTFEAGALLRTVDDEALAKFVGRTYGFDLRAGAWQAPAAKDGLELVLRSLFGGAFVVRVDGAAPDRMTVMIGSGVVDATGAVVLDDQGSRYETTTSLKDNPYAPIALPTLSLDVDGRVVKLFGAQITLGMTDEGTFDDVRLAGEVDVRDFGDVGGRGACHLLQAYSDQTCAPCASDGEPACFALSLAGLSAQ